MISPGARAAAKTKMLLYCNVLRHIGTIGRLMFGLVFGKLLLISNKNKLHLLPSVPYLVEPVAKDLFR